VMVRRGTGEQAMRGLPEEGAAVRLGLHPKDSKVLPES